MSCGCALAAPAGALGINMSCDRHNESRTAVNGRTVVTVRTGGREDTLETAERLRGPETRE